MRHQVLFVQQCHGAKQAPHKTYGALTRSIHQHGFGNALLDGPFFGVERQASEQFRQTDGRHGVALG
ncbi:MAG: hypothetical protein ACMV16_06200, partial [Macromonas sp.]